MFKKKKVSKVELMSYGFGITWVSMPTFLGGCSINIHGRQIWKPKLHLKHFC